MKRWLRPQGIILFLAFAALTAIVTFVLSGTIVERGVEKAGTSVVGARVDLGDVSFSFSPLGLAMTDLQVTNPRRPMENMVQVDYIAFNMDPGALLRRKLLVEEMALEGVVFNTPRETSGAIEKSSGEKGGTEQEAGFRMPALEVPPISQILEQEDLLSIQLSEDLREKAASEEGDVQDALSDLPDRAKASEYRERIDKLLAGDKISKARLDEAKNLQEEIRGERDKVRAAQDQISSSLAALRIRLKEARGAVGQDVRRITDKYALTPEGLANITRILFGDKVAAWTDRTAQALKILNRISSGSEEDPSEVRPPRGRGVDVALADRIPLPGYWVKKAALSLSIPSGDITGEALNLSSHQALLNKPATFEASGKNLAGGASLAAEGVLDRTDPASGRDGINLNYNGWRVADMPVSDNKSLSLTLLEGTVALDVSIIVRNDALEGEVRVDLVSVAMKAGGEGDTTIARAMRSALNEVHEFSLTADLGGTLDDPEIRLTSDLDRILGNAVGQAAREESRKLETGLNKAIEEKTGPALADAEKSMKLLESANEQLAAVKTVLEAALNAKPSVKLPF